MASSLECVVSNGDWCCENATWSIRSPPMVRKSQLHYTLRCWLCAFAWRRICVALKRDFTTSFNSEAMSLHTKYEAVMWDQRSHQASTTRWNLHSQARWLPRLLTLAIAMLIVMAAIVLHFLTVYFRRSTPNTGIETRTRPPILLR